MIEINIFNIDPLNFKIIFKFMCKVFPPIRECIFNEPWSQFGYSFKHATFDNAEKQINFFAFRFWFNVQLVKFCSIFLCSSPYSVFYGLDKNKLTLWTLSSFALRITIPITLFLIDKSWGRLINFRCGNAYAIELKLV